MRRFRGIYIYARNSLLMLKLRSFRIRIALLSAILAGTALAGFGLISWWLIYEAKVSRLDAELESQLMRAGRPRSRDRWQSYETSLGQSFGTNAKTPIALLVIGADGIAAAIKVAAY